MKTRYALLLSVVSTSIVFGSTHFLMTKKEPEPKRSEYVNCDDWQRHAEQDNIFECQVINVKRYGIYSRRVTRDIDKDIPKNAVLKSFDSGMYWIWRAEVEQCCRQTKTGGYCYYTSGKCTDDPGGAAITYGSFGWGGGQGS